MLCTSLLLAGGAIAWSLLTTEAGLIRVIKFAQHFIPGTVQWQSLHGNLRDGIVLRELQYQDDSILFQADYISAKIKLSALINKQLYFESFNAKQVEISVINQNNTVDNELDYQALLKQPPIDLIANNVEIDNIHISDKKQMLFSAKRILLDAQWSNDGIQVVRHTLITDTYQIKAYGDFNFNDPLNNKLTLEWRVTIPDYNTISGSSLLSGSLEQLKLDTNVSSPAKAQINVQISDLFGTLKWESIISSNDIPLDNIKSDFPPNTIGVDLHAYGDSAIINIDGQLRNDFIDLPQHTVDLHSRLRFSEKTINILKLELELPENKVHIAGKGKWSLAEQKLQAQINWQSLSWPMQGKADVESPAGTAEISGDLNDYNVKAQFRLNAQELDAGTWVLDGSGDLQQFTVNYLLAESFNGQSKVQGQIAWRPLLSWQLILESYDIDTGYISTELPGRINLIASSVGKISNDTTQIEINIEQLEGIISHYPIAGMASANYNGKTLSINKLELASLDNNLSIVGTYDEKNIDLAWQLDAKELSVISKNLQGKILSEGSLTGDPAAPVSVGHLTATALAIDEIEAELLDLTWKSTLNKKLPFTLQLTSTAATAYQKSFEKITIDGSGSIEKHKFSVSALGENTGLLLNASGKWINHIWHGHIGKADWRLPEVGQWKLAKPVNIKLSKTIVDIASACWNKKDAHICLETHGQIDANMNSKLSIKKLPIAFFSPWLPSDFSMDGIINADMDINTPDGGTSIGTGNIELPPGNYSFAAGGDSAPHVLAYAGGLVAMKLDAYGFHGNGKIVIKDDNRIQIEWDLKDLQHTRNFQNQPIDLTIEIKLDDLAFIDALLIDVEQLKGEIDSRLSISGTLSTPVFHGESHWKNGSLAIPTKGLIFENIDIGVVESDKDKFTLQGSIVSESGKIKFSGSIQVPDLEHWQTTLELQGEHFEIVDLPAVRILISPVLSAKIEPGLIIIDGQITIPEAQLRPLDLQSAVVNSKDVIIVDKQDNSPNKIPWAVSSRIKLIMGDNISLDGFGLKGWIDGEIEIIDEPGKAAVGRGELAIRDGSFRAYGSDLSIERGRLLFRGGALDNPGLDVDAIRNIEREQIKVGVKVRGSLLQPKLNTYSEPAMAQTETLSYLMFGKASDNASAGHQEMLIDTVSSIADRNNVLTKNLKERFGLSEVRFTGGWSKEDSALTLGKYLSPRLYVGYTFGLFESVDEFNMRYKLSDNWSLEMDTASDASSGDIYYSFER
ncbi:MAG: translocation/assembly module TamB domain-containing protein [Thiohalomonadales bacterium]